MSDPRWFTDEAWTKRRAVCFMDSDERHWTVEESDWPWTSKEASAEATDALVAAVRDAALLPERLRGYLNDPDTLADDINSQIHQHCNSDNSCSDEHNDWVSDLTGQIMKLLGMGENLPSPPDTGERAG